MCGICGVFNFDGREAVSGAALTRMNEQIVHRGPDDSGLFLAGNVGLAARRLSIIDVAGGHQPVGNEDDTVTIAFNGEIYNYKELQADLLNRGHRFKSNSDTETVVHLYEEYGPECVTRLRGMFAFAIWDANRRRLLVARDRLGIKPLYFCRTPGQLLFGSEIKALLAYPGVPRELNQTALWEYLACGFVSGEETLYDGIRKLLPGHYLEAAEDGVRITPYWDIPQPDAAAQRSDSQWVSAYREQLEYCVRSHLMSDVPLGVFLSGGIDSSAIAALMTRMCSDPIETFSVGYKEVQHSELPYAREMAKRLGSIHHEVQIGPADFFGALPALIWHEDEPITWPSSVSLYFVAKLAQERVKVVLTGEGSDETMAGYARYAWTAFNLRQHARYAGVVPAKLRALVRRACQSPLLGAALQRKLQHTFIGRDCASFTSAYLENYLCAFTESQMGRVLTRDHRPEPGAAYRTLLEHYDRSTGDPIQRMLYVDLKTYLVELLMKQDQMSMAASIESRVPFLDHVLVELAVQIPSHLKVRGFGGKQLLKVALQDVLPAEVLHRKKMGFPTPWSTWIGGPMLNQIQQLLLEPRTLARGILHPDNMRRIFAAHRAGKEDHADRIWRLLNLELWQRVCIEGDEDARRQTPVSAEPAAVMA